VRGTLLSLMSLLSHSALRLRTGIRRGRGERGRPARTPHPRDGAPPFRHSPLGRVHPHEVGTARSGMRTGETLRGGDREDLAQT